MRIRAAILLATLSFSSATAPLVAARTLTAPDPTAWDMWKDYAAHFISAAGRVMDPDRDSMTTSEGQSYAMFFSLVANDRATFERLRDWTESDLARGSLADNLPAWSWGRTPSGTWEVLDPNSASDADLWIAYDLLQAGRLWADSRYTEEGTAMLRHIARSEVATLPKLGPALLPGAYGFHPDADHWLLNLSYMPPPLLHAAAHSGAGGPWKAMAELLPRLLERSASSGFAMDWVSYSTDGAFAPAAGPGQPAPASQGSYDAIRVYLWLGLDDEEDPERQMMLENYAAMARALRAHPLPPESVSPDGILRGSGPLGFSAALVPYLIALHKNMLAVEQQDRVRAGMNRQSGLLGTPPRYYDQNLALFAMAWQEKRFRFGEDGALRVAWKS